MARDAGLGAGSSIVRLAAGCGVSPLSSAGGTSRSASTGARLEFGTRRARSPRSQGPSSCAGRRTDTVKVGAGAWPVRGHVRAPPMARPSSPSRSQVDASRRAAARPELGGVERWARELCARLPYDPWRRRRALVAPRRARVGAGVLPVRSAPRAGPAVPRPTSPRSPRATSSWSSTTPRRCATRSWYSGLYAAWQRRSCPLIARRARRVITVSRVLARELAELLGVDARWSPAASTRASPAGPRRRERPYVLCVASQPRARTSARSSPRRGRSRATASSCVVAGGHRPQFAAERGLDGPRRCSATCPTRAPGPLRGRRGVRAPVGLRGLRAARCSRRWRPARRSWPRTPPRCRRPAAARPRGSPSSRASSRAAGGARLRRSLGEAREYVSAPPVRREVVRTVACRRRVNGGHQGSRTAWRSRRWEP